jgi:hypothetical protein
MHIAIGITFMGHAIAHLVGFLVPWKVLELEEIPYKTTLLAGRIDVADNGIRVVGILWLFVAIAFTASGAGVIWVLLWCRDFLLF